MLRTGIETIICLSPNFLYVYVLLLYLISDQPQLNLSNRESLRPDFGVSTLEQYMSRTSNEFQSAQ